MHTYNYAGGYEPKFNSPQSLSMYSEFMVRREVTIGRTENGDWREENVLTAKKGMEKEHNI
jgi:hypothetical protein